MVVVVYPGIVLQPLDQQLQFVHRIHSILVDVLVEVGSCCSYRSNRSYLDSNVGKHGAMIEY